MITWSTCAEQTRSMASPMPSRMAFTCAKKPFSVVILRWRMLTRPV